MIESKVIAHCRRIKGFDDMFWLILIFIVTPAIEIAIFILAGNHLGLWSVLLLLLLTGMIGIALVRYQEFETWKSAQFSLHHGELPKEQILDGICIIIGGALLIAPGFLTDIIGFFLVIPSTRKLFKTWIKAWMTKRMSQGKI